MLTDFKICLPPMSRNGPGQPGLRCSERRAGGRTGERLDGRTGGWQDGGTGGWPIGRTVGQEDGRATEREDGRTRTQEDERATERATEREDGRTIAPATSKLFVRRITLYAHTYSLVDISPCCGRLLRRSVLHSVSARVGMRSLRYRPGFTFMLAHCG